MTPEADFTTPNQTVKHEEDDDDSLYDECTKVPHPQTSIFNETILDPNLSQVQRLDSLLDRQDEEHLNEQENERSNTSSTTVVTASSSNSNSNQVSSTLNNSNNHHNTLMVSDLVHHDEDDDWFDPDEKKVDVDVESLNSSSDDEQMQSTNTETNQTENQSSTKRNVRTKTQTQVATQTKSLPIPRASTMLPKSSKSPTFKSVASVPETETKSSTSNTTGFSILTKASHTFYKAFRRKKSTPAPAPADGPREEINARHVASIQMAEERLMRVLDAQLATLGGARAGYVDLSIVRSTTTEAAQAISRDARMVLQDFDKIRNEARIAAEARMNLSKDDLEREERVLVEAKLAVAEANDEVERLRYELRTVKKKIQDPCRKQWGMVKKVDQLRKEACAIRDARLAVEKRLQEREVVLKKESAELNRLEEGIRDIEGDWA